jgi:hypothetical protein
MEFSRQPMLARREISVQVERYAGFGVADIFAALYAAGIPPHKTVILA